MPHVTRHRLHSLFWTVVGLACFAGAAVALRRSVGTVDFSRVHFRALPMITASGLFAVSFLYSAVLWHDFLGLTGAASTRTRDAAAWMISQFGKYVPGNLTVLAIRMKRSPGRPAAVGTSYLYEALFHVAVAAAFALPALVMIATQTRSSFSYVLSLVSLSVPVLMPATFHRFANLMLSKAGYQPLAVPPPARGYTARLLFAVCLFWILASVTFWLFVASLTDGIPLFDATAAIAFAWVIGFVAVVVPGGIGVREAALVLVLGPLLGTGPSLLIAAVHRLWITVLDLAFSTAWYLLLTTVASVRT
jgi:hypothetical protein